jgi:hypothetical protein
MSVVLAYHWGISMPTDCIFLENKRIWICGPKGHRNINLGRVKRK